MKQRLRSFLRGFSFYRFMIPHKYHLKEKNVQEILSKDVFKVQQDIEHVIGKVEE